MYAITQVQIEGTIQVETLMIAFMGIVNTAILGNDLNKPIEFTIGEKSQ